MSKLKIDKIKLQDLSADEERKIIGGEENQNDGIFTKIVSHIVIETIVKTSTNSITTCPNPYTLNLTCDPGHQDSCGLCTTNYACDTKSRCN